MNQKTGIPVSESRRYFFQCYACKAKFACDISRLDPDGHLIPDRIVIDRAAYAGRKIACPNGHLPGEPTPQGFRYSAHKWLGYVSPPSAREMAIRQQLVIERIAAPCDGRCTNASGPDCDCVCGGENHGSRRLVVIRSDGGSIRQSTTPVVAEEP